MISRQKNTREEGSVLMMVAALLLLFGGISAAMATLSTAQSRTSAETLDMQQAQLLAESGVAYYFNQMVIDRTYFDNVTFGSKSVLGDGGFVLESAVPGTAQDHWELTIRGEFGSGSYRLKAMLGNSAIWFPKGVVLSGTGNDSDVILDITNGGLVASFDPADGPFDPSSPGPKGDIDVNGSVAIDSSSYVEGAADLTGTVTTGYADHITGSVTENGSPAAIEDIDPIVWDKYNGSKVANDNATLATVFGTKWTPVSGPENYGDLIVGDGGTYIVPAGTYRVRKMEITGGSTIIFDTSLGQVDLIYVGLGPGTGTGNDLTVTGGSSVQIDSGGTTNPLLTVLGTNADFKLLSGSTWGLNPGDSATGGYSQMISLGGNASSDGIDIDSSTFYGRVYAASHEVSITNSMLYGSVLSRKVTLNNGTIAIDESTLGDSIVDPFGASVLGSWKI